MTDINDIPSDTNDAQSSGSDTTVKPGKYWMAVEIGQVDLGYTQSEGAQVAVLLAFEDGDHAGEAVTWYGHFSEKTKQHTIRALRTLGWQGDDLSDLSTVTGRALCTVQVERGQKDGILRPRVRFVGGGSVALSNRMTDDQKRAFALSMKELARSIPAETPKKSAANGKAKPPVATDDIPF